MKTIGILGALPEEISHVVSALSDVNCETYAGVEYHIGYYADKKIVVCCAGMGKVNAASTTQVLITRYEVQMLIFSGIAGNMCSEITVGDVVIANELVHHDSEDSMIIQSAPFTTVYPSDASLIKVMEDACRKLSITYRVGRIATGDKFICDINIKTSIKNSCDPLCVEMEGAALAQVAMRNNIPFVVVRAMSDDCEVDIEYLRTKENTPEFDIVAYAKTASDITLTALSSL